MKNICITLHSIKKTEFNVTYMFCFLISDDVMLPQRTALFSPLCPYFTKRQKQDPLRASSRLHWEKRTS